MCAVLASGALALYSLKDVVGRALHAAASCALQRHAIAHFFR